MRQSELLPATSFLPSFLTETVLRRRTELLNPESSPDDKNPQDPNTGDQVRVDIYDEVPSSSRLIMLLSSMATIVIATCVLCLYSYSHLTGLGELKQLGELQALWVALGLGVVVPYGVNRFTPKTKGNPNNKSGK